MKCLDKKTYKIWKNIGCNARNGMQKEKLIEKSSGMGQLGQKKAIVFPLNRKKRIILK